MYLHIHTRIFDHKLSFLLKVQLNVCASMLEKIINNKQIEEINKEMSVELVLDSCTTIQSIQHWTHLVPVGSDAQTYGLKPARSNSLFTDS